MTTHTNINIEDILSLVLLAIAMLLPLLLFKPKPVSRESEETITVIKCYKCGYEETRRFTKGDYIGKIVGKCPRCSSPLYIHAIFVRRVEQDKHRGRDKHPIQGRTRTRCLMLAKKLHT